MAGLVRRMELRHLKYFVAVAETLNISQAARRLHISQPPLSRQIRDLEQEIGTTLFDRDRGGLRLTPAGEYFLAEARKILAHAKRAVGAARDAGKGQEGKVTIGLLSPLAGLFLPDVLRAFRQKFPLVDVDLVEMVPRQQIEALLDHQVDLAFLTAREVQPLGELAFEPMMEVELRLALAPEHRLAKLQRVPLAKLGLEKFIIIKRSAAPATHDFLLHLCRSSGFEPDVVKHSDGPRSILDLVAAGIGVSIVPELFQRCSSDVVMRQLTPKPPTVSLGMVWRKHDISPAIEALRTMIRLQLPSNSKTRGNLKLAATTPRRVRRNS
jgi:DNA-binding transcriptional LysR family regulator